MTTRILSGCLVLFCLIACAPATDDPPAGTVFTGTVATVAGPAQGSTTGGNQEGIGNAARFQTPNGFTFQGNDLFFVDSNNAKVFTIDLSTWAVTTYAGPQLTINGRGDEDGDWNTALFFDPAAIVSDGTSLYVADRGNHKIRKIPFAPNETRTVSTFAGDINHYTGDVEGIGTAARFYCPSGITYDGTFLFVADSMNNRIRKIDPATAEVTNFAGPAAGTYAIGMGFGFADGTGTDARFKAPERLCTDGTNLYVADSGNNSIRKIVIATAAVSTIAGPLPGTSGSGDTDGTGSAARFNYPCGITTDGINLFVADKQNNKIRKVVIATGVVTTLAGPAQGSTASGDIDGEASGATFNGPADLVLFGNYLFIGDTANNKIRRLE